MSRIVDTRSGWSDRRYPWGMTKGDFDNIRVFGRQLKPVAFGLTLAMVALCVFNVAAEGVLGDSVVSHIVAVMAGLSAAGLFFGWTFGSQHMAEVGLFMTGMTMTLRSAFLFWYEGANQIGIWLGVGTAVVAFGSFLLERADEGAASWRS